MGSLVCYFFFFSYSHNMMLNSKIQLKQDVRSMKLIHTFCLAKQDVAIFIGFSSALGVWGGGILNRFDYGEKRKKEITF